MDPLSYKARLQARIAAAGVPLDKLTPQAGLDLMIGLFEDEPAEGSLFCSWGNVAWYGDAEWGFDFAFEFPERSPPGRLSLKFKVGPPVLTGHTRNQVWRCNALGDFSAFRRAVEEMPAFVAWGRSPASAVAITDHVNYRYVESAPVDCWGVPDPSRPTEHALEEEWFRTDDVARLVHLFRQKWRGEEADAELLLSRYFLACCRKVWRLLPHEASRAAVEANERYNNGLATDDEVRRAEWHAEAVWIDFDEDPTPEDVVRWAEEVARITPAELAAMLPGSRPGDDLSPLGLLQDAAYLPFFCGPGFEENEGFRRFLPATLFREMVGDPFRPGDRRNPGDGWP